MFMLMFWYRPFLLPFSTPLLLPILLPKVWLDNFSATNFEPSGLHFCPSVLRNGGFSFALILPSAIHGFAVVSLVFCRRLSAAEPSGCFSWFSALLGGTSGLVCAFL
jgi:hypothetical protein